MASEPKIYLLQIPKTSKEIYISGKEALNIPDKTSGDWHFFNTWHALTPEKCPLYGKNQETNTNHIYGNYGIKNKTKGLMKLGFRVSEVSPVYAANHFRAILDLIYYCAKEKRMNLVVGSSMDFLDTEKEKAKLLKLALKMRAFLDREEDAAFSAWYEKERLPIYRGELY